MNFTIYIYGLADTKIESFENCHIDYYKPSRYLEILDHKNKTIAEFALADSDRLEIRYDA